MVSKLASKHFGTISILTLSTILVLLMIAWMGFHLAELPHQLLGGHIEDIRLNSWFVYQALENLLHHSGDLGHSGMYYGEPASFGYSIAPYGIAIVTLPLYLLSGGNLELTYNLYFIATYVLTAWITYLLIVYLFKPVTAIAILCSMMLTFAQFRMLHVVHIETLSTHFFLLALYCLHRLLDERHWKWTLGFAISFWFTITTSGSLGMAFVIIGTIIVLYAFIKHHAIFTIQLFVQFAAAAVLIVAMIWPFYSFRRQNPAFAKGYPLAETIYYSATPLGWLAGTSFIYSRITPFLEENTLFIGIIPIALAVIAWRTRKQATSHQLDRLFSTRDLIALYGLITVVGYVSSVGPGINLGDHGIIPLPYSLLVNLPGFSSVRVGARYLWLAVVGTSFLSACALHYLATHKTYFRILFVLIAMGLTVELLPNNGDQSDPLFFKSQPIDHDNSAYAWLRQQREETPIAEYPFGGHLAVLYVHAQRYHGQQILNGWGSFRPDWQADLDTDNLASDFSLDFLRSRHIQYILVHNEHLWRNHYAGLTQNVAHFVREGRLIFFRSFGKVDVYKLAN